MSKPIITTKDLSQAILLIVARARTNRWKLGQELRAMFGREISDAEFEAGFAPLRRKIIRVRGQGGYLQAA